MKVQHIQIGCRSFLEGAKHPDTGYIYFPNGNVFISRIIMCLPEGCWIQIMKLKRSRKDIYRVGLSVCDKTLVPELTFPRITESLEEARDHLLELETLFGFHLRCQKGHGLEPKYRMISGCHKLQRRSHDLFRNARRIEDPSGWVPTYKGIE